MDSETPVGWGWYDRYGFLRMQERRPTRVRDREGRPVEPFPVYRSPGRGDAERRVAVGWGYRGRRGTAFQERRPSRARDENGNVAVPFSVWASPDHARGDR